MSTTHYPGSSSRDRSTSAGGTIPGTGAVLRADWFSVMPSWERATQVAYAGRQLWQYNAINAVQVASTGLGRDLGVLSRAILNVDLDRRLSPRLHARLSAVMEAIAKKDGYMVYDQMQAWCSDEPSQWYADEMETESMAIHAWETGLIREVRSTQVADQAPLEFFPLLGAETAEWHATALRALELIGEVDPEMAAEIRTHVALIKLFQGDGMEGLSSPKAFGAIWLKAPEPERALAWFLEHLVHECSHLHLNNLMAFDPVLTNPMEIHQAPIRPDPRPMFQVLHGTFVLARNCRVHGRLQDRFPELGLSTQLEKFREQYGRGLQVTREFMKSTAMGSLLLQSLPESGVEASA